MDNLAKHKVSEIMIKGLVTLDPDDPIVDGIVFNVYNHDFC